MKEVEISCPKCNNKQIMNVPDGVCIPFQKCDSCGERIETTHLCE